MRSFAQSTLCISTQICHFMWKKVFRQRRTVVNVPPRNYFRSPTATFIIKPFAIHTQPDGPVQESSTTSLDFEFYLPVGKTHPSHLRLPHLWQILQFSLRLVRCKWHLYKQRVLWKITAKASLLPMLKAGLFIRGLFFVGQKKTLYVNSWPN